MVGSKFCKPRAKNLKIASRATVPSTALQTKRGEIPDPFRRASDVVTGKWSYDFKTAQGNSRWFSNSCTDSHSHSQVFPYYNSGLENLQRMRTHWLLLLLLLLLIHTFSVLSLQLKKLRWHNKSAIDLSNANPACGHKEVRRSTGHIMVTTRYSDQQGSKSRQKVMRLYKRWHRPISKRFIKPPYSIREQPRSTRNVVAYPRPAFSAKNRKNYAPTSFINKSKFLKATHFVQK